MFNLLQKMSKNACMGYSAYKTINYRDAVKKLQDLQSNRAYLDSVANSPQINRSDKLKDTEKYLLRSGISLEQLDNLSVIHVTGSKGKGTVCSIAEAILQEHGFRTGFFSSPHLISVRERFRINSTPISETSFVYYFNEVYRKLENAKDFESDMPTYFKFLTILMFNIFLYENIDVAIIEVGIGGELDCTNIVRNPVCVGITSLALEHTSLLGNTIEEIAFQKSGIFKPNTKAFTVPQPKEALLVLEKRAVERQCTLHVISSFKNYEWGNKLLNNQKLNKIQRQNMILAILLAVEWIKSQNKEEYYSIINNKCDSGFHKNVEPCVKSIHLEKQDNIYEQYNTEYVSYEKIAAALSSHVWPGRQQILKGVSIDFYLDGAHTPESIDYCISWFNSHIKENNSKLYLIFNITGKRDVSLFLRRLKSIKFYKVYFVPNLSGILDVDIQTNFETLNNQKLQCQQFAEMWGECSTVANNVMEILYNIKTENAHNETMTCKNKAQVLVTGSLHLVGAALAILDPNFSMSTTF